MPRKSTTSTEVKQRYLDKTYTQISVRLHKELAEEFKATCKATNTPIAEVVKEAAEAFIEKNKKEQ